MKNYKDLVENQNFKRGGLGSDIGSETWVKRKIKKEKQKSFAEGVRFMNA